MAIINLDVFCSFRFTEFEKFSTHFEKKEKTSQQTGCKEVKSHLFRL